MSNNRFKFRCGITVSHYDDDGNDIETVLLVKDISLFDDGDVGFNKESLKEAVKEAVKREKLTEEEERTLWNSLDEYEVFEDWYQMSADFIEQCTGFKDKNGKLIYEGDVVLNKKGFKYTIRWHETDGYWASVSMEKRWWIMEESKHYETIGNIHENKELLND